VSSLQLFHRAARQLANSHGVSVAVIVAACNRAVERDSTEADNIILDDVHQLMLAASEAT
jgi:hypothetical protein